MIKKVSEICQESQVVSPESGIETILAMELINNYKKKYLEIIKWIRYGG